MKPVKLNPLLAPLKTWKPTFLKDENKNRINKSNNSDDTVTDLKSDLETPRSNLLDSFNLYSALDSDNVKLENTASYLPPIREIAKKYKQIGTTVSSTAVSNDFEKIFNRPESDLKKFTRLHIKDPNLLREKSIIEKSIFYKTNKKLSKKKNQINSKFRYHITDTADPSDRKDLIEAVRNSLPNINTVYKNEQGLESRMNSFYFENLKRINKHEAPFCEYAKEHADHEKEKTKTNKHNCVFCAAQNHGKVGSLAPENSFIDENMKPKTPKTPNKSSLKLPSLKHYHNHSNQNNNKLVTKNQSEFNQAISALNPPERSKKTYFCDVLGEKYCLGCIECHERRFAKVYETKYMNDSDPLVVTMNLLINQRIPIK